uniref:Uncharacterized protein n=1 Tax=Onchocerca volvulus TaxID=6282 RepID=A0A8R1XXN6_ONCVO
MKKWKRELCIIDVEINKKQFPMKISFSTGSNQKKNPSYSRLCCELRSTKRKYTAIIQKYYNFFIQF